jgi:hypothetical protein
MVADSSLMWTTMEFFVIMEEFLFVPRNLSLQHIFDDLAVCVMFSIISI